MNSITASIVLYNNDISILKKTVNSLFNNSLIKCLFLIDNSENNNLEQYFLDDRIVYIHNPSNPGFGASHNLAIVRSIQQQSKYHIIVNPDIFFEIGTIESIFDFMENNLSVGHLMPKILYPNGKIQFLCKHNPTFFDLFVRGFVPESLKKVLKKRINWYDYRDCDLDNLIFNISYLSGCFMFFRTSALKKVGFFDENIFMYLEDADITRRFLEYSDTCYFPNATVYHYYSGLTHKEWKFKLITIKSAFYYFSKWGWRKSII